MTTLLHPQVNVLISYIPLQAAVLNLRSKDCSPHLLTLQSSCGIYLQANNNNYLFVLLAVINTFDECFFLSQQNVKWDVI